MTEKTRPRQKILMLIPQLGYGGAETSFVRLANFLTRYHDVTIVLFTRHYGGKSYSNAGLEPESSIILLDPVEEALSRLKRWITRWRKFQELKRANDLAISFLTGPNLLNALVGCRRKTIISIRGSRIYDPSLKWWMRYFYQLVLDPVVYNFSNQIVGISAGLANELPKRSRHKFKMIELFINSNQMISRSVEPIEEEMDLLNGQPVIVTAGRLSVEKGIQPLVDVFAQLTKRIANAKLLIIGDGPLYKTLETQCEFLGLSLNNFDASKASVILTGYRENPLRYFKVASVFVLSSLTEGFSNAVVEALASGILVMAVNGPWGVRSILYNNPPDISSPYPTETPQTADYGLLMPRIDSPHYKQVWVDKLYEVLSNPDAYANLAKQGPDRARQLDQCIIGCKWLALVDEMCARDAQS